MPAPRYMMDPLEQIRRELDQVFDKVLGEGFGPMLTPRQETTELSPLLDVRIEGDTVRVEADLPGVEPENVECTFREGTLTIKGERRESGGDGSIVRERRFGRFERRITLPEGIDEESLDARFQNGVLTVTARMKSGVGQQRRIQIAGTAEPKQEGGAQQAKSASVQPEKGQQSQGSQEQQSGSQRENANRQQKT